MKNAQVGLIKAAAEMKNARISMINAVAEMMNARGFVINAAGEMMVAIPHKSQRLAYPNIGLEMIGSLARPIPQKL
jgi:hypothetical protein